MTVVVDGTADLLALVDGVGFGGAGGETAGGGGVSLVVRAAGAAACGCWAMVLPVVPFMGTVTSVVVAALDLRRRRGMQGTQKLNR